jgi:anti-sigma factor RsiW
MSTCEYSAKISAYHDDALPPAIRKDVEAHLNSCGDCAREVEELQRLSNLFAAARNAPVRSVVRLHDLREVQSALRFEKVLIGAAASILLICGSWLAYQPLSGGITTSNASLDGLVLNQNDRSTDVSDPLLQAFVREYGSD